MKTESLMRNARVLMRADGIIAEIRLRSLATRSGLQLAAGLVGLFGAVMLGIAAFLALERVTGPILAAVVVGSAALILAALLVLVAGRVKPGRDLSVAEALRDSATEALVADLKVLEAEVAGFARVLRHPLDGALPGLVLPLATMLLKSLKKSPAAAEKP